MGSLLVGAGLLEFAGVGREHPDADSAVFAR